MEREEERCCEDENTCEDEDADTSEEDTSDDDSSDSDSSSESDTCSSSESCGEAVSECGQTEHEPVTSDSIERHLANACDKISDSTTDVETCDPSPKTPAPSDHGIRKVAYSPQCKEKPIEDRYYEELTSLRQLRKRLIFSINQHYLSENEIIEESHLPSVEKLIQDLETWKRVESMAKQEAELIRSIQSKGSKVFLEEIQQEEKEVKEDFAKKLKPKLDRMIDLERRIAKLTQMAAEDSFTKLHALKLHGKLPIRCPIMKVSQFDPNLVYGKRCMLNSPPCGSDHPYLDEPTGSKYDQVPDTAEPRIEDEPAPTSTQPEVTLPPRKTKTKKVKSCEIPKECLEDKSTLPECEPEVTPVVCPPPTRSRVTPFRASRPLLSGTRRIKPVTSEPDCSKQDSD